MSRLLSNGLIAALAPQGVPNMDIVVTSVSGSHLCSIQVKTRWDKGTDGGWHMSKKHELIQHPRMFYCFVDLGKDARDAQKIYVIPSGIVADVIELSHRTWLSSPGKNGHVRKDSNTRRFLPDYTKILGDQTKFGAGWLNHFEEAWRLVNQDDEMILASECMSLI